MTSWHDYPGALLGWTERPLIKWLGANVRKGETWLDVGAHYGYVSLALAEFVTTEGKVLAFEPVTQTAGCLNTTKDINGLTQLYVVPLGLGAHPGINLSDVSTTRGMAEHSDRSMVSKQTIVTTAFDTLRAQIPDLQAISGIKIDVQGMELEVLRGMRATLQECRPLLVIELHEDVSRNDLCRILQECGYSPHPQCLEQEVHSNGGPLDRNTSYVFRPS